MAEPVANTDFTNVDRSAGAELFVHHLDRISKMEQVQAYKRRTFDLLEVREGSSALDVGCGTGDDARALAERVGATGRVVGLDNSATMIEEARKRVEGLGLPVDYRVGDARRLDFPDASFDACRIDRVLHHLDDPQSAVAELVRVARPGARVVMHEPD
jgi:ubiquinone/menaquinone biosynthesis C-methylase UbiE